jgi:hypothetical protein
MRKNMVFIYLLLGVIFMCLIQTSRIQEGLENNNVVVLLGDSVFKNNSYVEYKESVEYKLKNEIESLVLAEDNSLIKDVIPQYKKMPKDFNNSNTYLFVSIGGNDLLNKYHYMTHDIENMTEFDKIWKEYEKTLLELKFKTDCTLVLTDLYYIKDPDYVKYHDIIRKWNDNIDKFCYEKDILIYKISNLVKEKKHFVNSIEPSKLGSDIIVKNIIKF